MIPYVLVYKGDPDEGFCNLTAAWHIQKGSYNDMINFDGLNVVGLFHSPGNMLTGPKLEAPLYIDERAKNRLIRLPQCTQVKLDVFLLLFPS